jgi:hypothetical protein
VNLGPAGKSAKWKALLQIMINFKSLRTRYLRKKLELPYGISFNLSASSMTLRLMNTIYIRGKEAKGRKGQIMAWKLLVIAIFRCEVHL